MFDIEREIDALLKREGGYVDHPSDKGGATNYGITKAVAEQAGFRGDMRDFPRDLARIIYKQRYWFGPKFHEVAKHSQAIAAELFDTGVNMGTAVAAKFLQRALNAFNKKGALYPDIGVDGVIGNATINALKSFLSARGGEGESVLVKALNSLQAARYFEITEARPANEDFIYGWIKERVA